MSVLSDDVMVLLPPAGNNKTVASLSAHRTASQKAWSNSGCYRTDTAFDSS